jgi:N-acetylglucosamine-6-phosphate deacetylase
MKSMRVTGRHYRAGNAIEAMVEDGRFAEIRTLDTEPKDLPWIAPGLIDAQINGFGGIDFNRSPQGCEPWEQVCHALYAAGCTGFLTTFISHAPDEARALAEAWEAERKNNPLNGLGYHLEGPFLNPSPGTRGAHPPEVMRPADSAWFDGAWKALEGQIKLITVAPETGADGGVAFIQDSVRRGICISIGHSEAMGEGLSRAVDAGASSWTHLGNAVGSPMSKFENVIFHALAEDRLKCFLIPDGHHVPPHVFKVLACALGDRLLLTTDAMSGAGEGRGHFTLSGTEVTVTEEGVARHPVTGRLAGSTLRPIDGVFKASEMAGREWSDMWDAFSTRVAAQLGLRHGLEVGCPADFCLLAPGSIPRLIATVQRGIVKFGKSA